MPAGLRGIDWNIPTPEPAIELTAESWDQLGAFTWVLRHPQPSRYRAEIIWDVKSSQDWLWRVIDRDNSIVSDGSLSPSPLSAFQNLELAKRYCLDTLRFLRTLP